MNLIESLNWRYATKEFDPSKKISKENLDLITESLRLTPSSFGLQPWKFFMISNQEMKNSLLEHSWNQKQVTDCSHHIVLCHPSEFGDENIESFIAETAKIRNQTLDDLKGYEEVIKGFLSNMDENKKRIWMKHQVYISLGSLMTTCALLKIDACPMEGIVHAKYDEVLGLKEKGYMTAVACAIGFRKDSDSYATAQKVRYPISKVVEYID